MSRSAAMRIGARVLGMTVAEFFPRQVMHLQRILDGFPLLSPLPADR